MRLIISRETSRSIVTMNLNFLSVIHCNKLIINNASNKNTTDKYYGHNT